MSKKYFHFKLSDTKEDVRNIIKHPKKIAIFIGVFVTIILCIIILIKIDKHTKNNFNSENKNISNNLIIAPTLDNYKDQVKKLLGEFFMDRNSKEIDKDFCLNLVNKTLDKTLNLKVPLEEKNVHLELVILLDKESFYCKNQDPSVKINLTKRWKKFLNKNNWLTQ